MSQQILEQILDEIKEIKQVHINMEQNLQATNDCLTSMESQQKAIQKQTAKLSEYHTEVLAKLENVATKDDLTYFDKKIGEHEREIFKFKNA